MKQQTVYINKHSWVITLSDSKELEFYYVESHRIKKHPLWDSWYDSEDESSYTTKNYSDNVLPTNVSPFLVVTTLLNKIADIINQNTTFFYFTPSTEKKSKFYTLIIDKLITKLHGNWSYQIIKGTWFYIYKVDNEY